jgi:lactobin A/cerein 7B family class IIb bacteriocin
MTINFAEMPDQCSDIRALTDAELANVNGGFAILILAGLFAAGELLGGYIFDRMHPIWPK